jgi:hypothetical protein
MTTPTASWLQAEHLVPLLHLHGIVETSDGSIWVQHAHDDAKRSGILRCSQDGQVLETIQLDAMPIPHGLEVYKHPDHGECLLVTDCRSGLLLLDSTGTVIWHLDKPDFYKLHWTLAWSPSNCAIAADGTIYLADGYGSGFITVLAPDGSQLGTFGGPGTGPGNLVHPHGLAVVTLQGESVIAIGECQYSQQDPALLQRFDARSCIKCFGLDGSFRGRIDCDTISPRHFRADGSGGWIVPDFQGRLLLLDGDLRLQQRIGQDDERFSGTCQPQLTLPRPHDCCVLRDGRLLISDFTGKVHQLELT